MKKLVLGILAHVDAGKTTLSEALLYTCGSIRKLGRVDHRNTALDTHQIERERGITVFSKQAQLRTENMELCLLDTPGHADLTAETERVLDVLDYALLVISGTDGVQAHTETLWHLLERHRVPTIIFATKMDLTASDREKILGDLRARLSENCFDLSDKSQETRESIAMCDEALLEKVASGGDIEDSDLTHLISGRKLFPVLYGSGLKLEGVSELVEFIENYTVSPVYTEEFGARVYKIMRDARGRRLSCMKITGGVLRNRDNVDGQTVTELRVYSGANYEAVQEACAGSIVAVQGLDDTYAGQGLGFENDGMQQETEAVMSYTVALPKGADAWVSYKQLKQLEDEDPQLHIEWNERLREISVRIMGRVQTEVLTELIRERFDLEVSIASGGIAYKETIAAPVHGIGHFEPLRHYAEVHLLIEPNERGSGLSFESRCPTDELCSNWQSLIMTNLAEKTHLGVLTGSPLTDVKISALRARAHFASPTHRDYMGAILGLGIKREWLGDIWVNGEEAVIFVMQTVERHIADGLEKVGRYGVKLQRAELNELTPPERKVKRVSFSVKSMRFDAVLAGMFGLSRTAAASHIAAGEASLNYSECLKNDALVSPGDIISLRGCGKGAVSELGGLSRKGRLFVEAEIYK